MFDVQSVAPGGGRTEQPPAAGDGRAAEVAADHSVRYVAGEHRFEVMLDGKPTPLSPMEAVCLVLQNRYLALSDSTAEKTQRMQEQVDRINETNNWLNALKAARDPNDGFLHKPQSVSPELEQWMDTNNIDPNAMHSQMAEGDFDRLEAKFSSRIDQLSSTNELRMLQLKTAVNKSQEALAAADGLLQDLKQLMQTITANMAR